MSKTNTNDHVLEHANSAPKGNGSACCDVTKASAGTSLQQKTKLEKTQSLLTVISTSIGLIGVAGSVFAMGLATFYTGSVEIRPDTESSNVIVKVYTKEGHESVFHSKHIELMPGVYHLEISSADGKVVNADTKIRFHKTSLVPVFFGRSTQSANSISAISTAQSGNSNSTNSMSGSSPGANQTENDSLPRRGFSNLNESQQTETTQQATNRQAAPPQATIHEQEDASVSANNSETGTAAKLAATGAAAKRHHWWQFWKHPIVDFDDADDKQQ